ncbi:MAG: Uma2 family endonuclease [Actinocatenispora sp.]
MTNREDDAAQEGDATMSAQPVGYDPPEPTTGEDLAELLDLIAHAPDDRYRYEILDGELVGNPPATWSHENRVRRLQLAVLRVLPHGWAAYTNAGFIIGDEHVIPDLAVVDAELPDVEQQWGEAPLRLVVEVESVTTKHRDRKLKCELYAHRDIDAYWRIERDGSTHVHTMPQVDGTWDEVRTVRPGETLPVSVPFEIELAPADWL